MPGAYVVALVWTPNPLVTECMGIEMLVKISSAKINSLNSSSLWQGKESSPLHRLLLTHPVCLSTQIKRLTPFLPACHLPLLPPPLNEVLLFKVSLSLTP